YPAELRGRDGEAFTPRSPSSASAAMAGFDRTARGSAAWGGCRRWPDFSPSSLSARCETAIMHPQIRGLISQEILLFLSNFAVGLTLDVPAFTFSIAAAASFFWSTALV